MLIKFIFPVTAILIFILLYKITHLMDPESAFKINKKMLIICSIGFLLANIKIFMTERSLPALFLLGIFCGYMLFNACTDLYSQDIYTAFYPVMTLIGFIYLIGVREYPLYLSITLYVIIWILQRFLFSRYYGRGDASVLIICSLFLGYDIIPLEENLLINMAALFLGLVIFTVVNIFAKNMDKKLKLKKPEAFVPYIMLATMIFI